MPFGLLNVPSTFQRFMNELFADLLDICIIVYLDDILIYSKNLKEHKKQVKEVLRCLKANGLYVSPSKCKFHQEQVEFLRFILSPKGLQMNGEKVRIIQEWPPLRRLKDVQSFLGFANFYRRFINNYSKIIIPLTRLTRKDTPWLWSEDCQQAFDTLRLVFMSVPILTHWDPNAPIFIESDASDYALATILSTKVGDEIHPIAFHSRTFSATEMNYDVHDKELLAIYEAFCKWRHYLEGTSIPVEVLTDHKNLTYFQESKSLSRHQTRWLEFLSHFNMIIKFRPGCLGTKPDVLTHRWDLYLKNGNNDFLETNPQNYHLLFSAKQLSPSARATYLSTTPPQMAQTLDCKVLHQSIREATLANPELRK